MATKTPTPSGADMDYSNKYERMVCDSTSSVARAFIPELIKRHPITPESYILDNACGTGIVTSLLKVSFPSVKIHAVDFAPAMLTIFDAKVGENSWSDVTSELLDVKDLSTIKDDTFSHVITNFGIGPDSTDGEKSAVKEMKRVLRKGGVAVSSVWCVRIFPTLWHDIMLKVRPNDEPFDLDFSSWNTSTWLTQRLEAVFGNQIEVRRVEGRARAATVEEFADNMLLVSDILFSGYSQEELTQVRKLLIEGMPKDAAFEQGEWGVGVKMVAWVGYAWK